jgi:hypothetical protein
MEKPLRQRHNPSEKTISMLGLNSILQPSDLPCKFSLPPTERHILLSKNSNISAHVIIQSYVDPICLFLSLPFITAILCIITLWGYCLVWFLRTSNWRGPWSSVDCWVHWLSFGIIVCACSHLIVLEHNVIILSCVISFSIFTQLDSSMWRNVERHNNNWWFCDWVICWQFFTCS